MQFDPLEHFDQIVAPACEAYFQAEVDLTTAVTEHAPSEVQTAARYRALREGGAAALYLHHFADVVAARGADRPPRMKGNLRDVREQLATISAQQLGESDISLLTDVADSLKHAVLRSDQRDVTEAGQVLVISRAYGTGRFGEGKYGGTDEVWVFAKSGKRPLRTVLRSVMKAWRLVLAED